MWSCQRCTFLNDKWFTRCKMCRAKKRSAYFGAFGEGSVEKDITMWSCQRCTVLNDEWFKRCKMCWATKSSEDVGACGGKETETGVLCGGKETETDLPCSTCTFINKSYHRKCKMCYSVLKICQCGQGDTGHQHNDPSYNDFDAVNEIRIVLIGRTGSGKSATGNSILGVKHFESLVSGSSVTSKCKRGETFRRGKKIIVVDTPGLFDTGMTNEKVTMEIVKCIGMTSPGPHAMVLVVGISRFTKEEQDTVQHFVEHFGEGMLRYMIVLFTRKDELSKSNQSIHQFVQTVPKELKTILINCGNRYIAFNNDAVGPEQETQQEEFLDLVDTMLSNNGNACYTNEHYQAAEATVQRRMRQQRENLKRQKERELDEIKSQVERRYEHKLTKEILEKSKLEADLDSSKKREKNAKDEKKSMVNELQHLRQQLNQRQRAASSRDIEEKRKTELKIRSLQKRLKEVEQENYARDQAQLQEELNALNSRHQQELEGKNKEIRRLSKQKDDEYKRKMDKETLRQNERDKVENENTGILDDIVGGLKKVGSGIVKAGKALLNFFF